MRRPFRRAIIVALLSNLLLSCAWAGDASSTQPNLLIIMADDCTHNDLSLYGGGNAKTPNIDRLAAEGLTFNRAYLCSAMCQPCRAELYSGQDPGAAQDTHEALEAARRGEHLYQPPGPVSAEQRTLLQVFRDEFIAITPGKGKFPKSYQMGRGGGGPREQPPRNIVFGYDFAVAKYEVPQNLWEAVMGSNPSRWKGPRNSVEMLSHADARAFCRAATRFMRSANLIANDELIRLPTEAEWEYFARAGSTTRYSFGDDSAAIDAFAWHTGNAAGNDPPVGAKRPNPWGLYDIHGYLWEWCEDVAHESYAQLPTDGSPAGGVDPQSQRVLRGGSWKDTPDRLTSSYRRFAPQDTADDAIGLRCVLAKVTAASRRTTHGENHSP